MSHHAQEKFRINSAIGYIQSIPLYHCFNFQGRHTSNIQPLQGFKDKDSVNAVKNLRSKPCFSEGVDRCSTQFVRVLGKPLHEFA